MVFAALPTIFSTNKFVPNAFQYILSKKRSQKNILENSLFLLCVLCAHFFTKQLYTAMNKRQFLATAGASALALSLKPSATIQAHQAQGSTNKGLYMIWQGKLHQFNQTTGETRKLSDDNWASTGLMTSLNGKLYASAGNLLYMINPNDGTYKKLSNDSWIGTAFLYGAGSDLYAISQGKFYRISPNDGTFKEIPTKTLEFIGVKNLVLCNGKMYCITGSVCTIDTTTGSVAAVKNDNWGATAPDLFTTLGGMLYVINSGTLYSINPTDGAYKALSEDDWSSAKELVALDGKLYIYADSAVYSLDPQTGAFTNIGNRRTLKNAYCVTAVE
jgi:hypothetical protein